MKSGRRPRIERNANNERNETHVVYVKDDTVKTPAQSERIMGLPVGQASALSEICKVQGNETIDAKYLTKVPHSAALILFFGKKPQVDILRAKHPRGNLPIEKAKGFAIVNFNGDDLELDALCAHESTRGMGVGANTLKYIETMATLNGKKQVLLDALPGAVPFYVKQGYRNTRDNFYAKELVPQEGGVFKWAGADTPVFNNEKVREWNGFPIMWMEGVDEEKKKERQAWLDGQLKKFGAVVRMVSSGDGEITIHRMLKDMITKKDPPFNDDFVKMHINLWAGPGIYRVNYDQTLAAVKTQNDGKAGKLERINARFADAAKTQGKGFKWYGLITRTQSMDVSDLPIVNRVHALCTILRVLLHIDGRIVHFDLHWRNMAVMGVGTPVIHDVGRMKIRDALDTFAPWEISCPYKTNKRILRNVLMHIFQWPNYNMDYKQYFYIARMFKDLRKTWGETFPKPVEPEWKHFDQPPPGTAEDKFEANIKDFEPWLDESSGASGDEVKDRRQRAANWVKWIKDKNPNELMKVYDEAGNVLDVIPDDGFVYFDPPRETRYHQIARVFDILSVLAALSATASRERVAYYWARRAAVKICTLLTASPPAATRARVQEIARRFLATTGTSGDCGGNDPGKETEYATKYLVEVNDARTGKKFPAEMTDEQKAAAAAAKAKADRLAQRAKEIFEKKIDAVKEAARQKVRDEFARRRQARQALAEAEAAPPAAQSPVEAVEDVGELDKAVIEGLNVESPVSEEDKRVPPEGLPLDEAVAAMSEILRQSQEEEGEHEEQKGLYLSPVEVIAEADNAPPMENAPPDIKRLRDLPVADEGAGEQAVEGSLDLSSPLTGVDYEVNSKGKAEPVVPPTDGRQEGGVFKAAGYTAITFEAGPGEDPWKFLPPPAEGATLPPLVGLDPTKFVAYVSPDTKIVEIHDLVKSASSGPESPVGRITNTYLAHYPCTLAGMTNYTVWKRVNGRLQRQVRHFPELPTLREDETIHNITEFSQLECLLVLKFKETVQDLVYPQEKRKALFEILDGLVEVDGAFVINDLHEGNIAVMPDGHAVTFDYDRTCTSEEFKSDVNTILANIATYEDLPQYKHIVDLEGDANREEKIEKLVKISDILAVLTAVEAVTGAGVARATPAFEACRKALWKSETKEQRHAAINALDAALPVSGGGRRTFRRKGLPQLL
jgi:GNAT superfamily N-acetyltransferase